MDETPSSVVQGSSYAGGSPFKGFWIRLVAAIIDGVLLLIAFFVFAILITVIFGGLGGLLGGEEGTFGAGLMGFLLAILVFTIFQLLYKPLMEASEFQGTLGKYMLGMKVVKANGERLDMGTSFVRSIVYLVCMALMSLVVPVLAFFMIGFTEQKQGLHDIVAKTFVVPQHWSGPIPVPQDGFGA
ncbi:MAG: RDD family protein [Candidatus Poseidoniia archaeon]|nr:RDD family protein [Candidatus Poseidoniia archaeon]